MPVQPAFFESHAIRCVYDEESEIWWFSVVDIVQVLTQQADYQTASKYWNKLKERLGKEGSQLVTDCHQLKMTAEDGKQRLSDVATAETLLRLVQSVPSPKAEPIKLWLAKAGYERMQEIADPGRSLDRARATWQKHGRSEKWIAQRMTGQETRNKRTDYWANHDIKPGEEYAILTNLIHQEWSGAIARQARKALEAKTGKPVVISENFNPKQRVFLDFVLSHYVAVGVEELDQAKLTPLLKLKYHDSISDAVADLGKPEEIGKVFSGFQKYLYAATAA